MLYLCFFIPEINVGGVQWQDKTLFYCLYAFYVPIAALSLPPQPYFAVLSAMKWIVTELVM